jgi:hypothetical protein
MKDEEFIRAARVLSSDHGLRILRVFSDDQWKIASEISSQLDIHTSTASKYLDLLHGRGLLERRVRKTVRRSTFEYHLKSPTIMLELDISRGREVKGVECWDACISLFHRLVSTCIEMGLSGFDDDVAGVMRKLEEETGMGSLALFDPKRNVSVAKRLVRKRIEDGQLDDRASTITDVSQTVFDAIKSLCVERMGGPATKKLFKSVISKIEDENGGIARELGLTDLLKRGFANA